MEEDVSETTFIIVAALIIFQIMWWGYWIMWSLERIEKRLKELGKPEEK